MSDEDRLRRWLNASDSVARISVTDWNRLKRMLREVRADERKKRRSSPTKGPEHGR